MQYKKLSIYLALTGIFTTAPLFAQSEPAHPAAPVNMDQLLAEGPGMMMMGGPAAALAVKRCPRGGKFDNLNLTDEQYERLYQVKKETLAKFTAKGAELVIANTELYDAMLQPSLDKSKLTALQNRINALHTDLANIKFESEFNAMSVLTPEQRKDMRLEMVKRFAGGGPGSGMSCGRGLH